MSQFFRRLAWLLAALVVASGVQAQTADAERIALVIGNSAYKAVPLPNPRNDAKSMGDLLRRAGFSVDQRLDTSQADLKDAIDKFGKAIRNPRVKFGLFYYAGHGLQLEWRNYLVPVNADIRGEQDVKKQTVDVSELLAYMDQAKGRSFLVILDACRDDPFAGTYRPSAKGLSQFDAPVGSLLAYATAPGNVALDGEGENGLYTSSLLQEFAAPGVRLEDAFKRVRLTVRLASKGKQIPWESTSLEEDVYLFPTQKRKLTDAEQEQQLEKELQAWVRVKSTNNVEQLAGFLREHPSGYVSELAQSRLSRLLSQQAQEQASVEADRRTREQAQAVQVAEATRKADAERKARDEAARLAEAERKAREEAERIARAEADRLAREEQARRQAEAARLAREAEARRLAEAERLAREEAQRQAEAAERVRQEAIRVAQAQAAAAEKARREAELRAQAEAADRARQEAQRQLEVARLAREEEQRRQAEAERIAREEEARRVAQAQAAERARQEALRQAEVARVAREAEAQRLAELQRQQVAAAPAPAPVVRPVALAATPFSAGFAEHDRRYLVGDVHQFRVIDTLTKAERPLQLQVTRVDEGDDRVEFNGGEYVSDLMGNISSNLRGTFSGPRQFYPAELFVGKKWQTMFRQNRPNGVSYTFRYDVKVVARERVTVPAGTFDTFKIEARGYNLQLGATLTRNIWVAPGVAADIAHETQVRLRNNAIEQYERQELVALRKAPGTAPR